MTVEPVSLLPPISGVRAADPGPPPPEPATFDFAVSSLTVKNPRSLFNDTDFATLAINVLAADGTVLKQYGPVAQSLGNLGKNLTVDPKMALTGLAIPDGGSIAVAFLVVNKGGWKWDSVAVNSMELAGTAVLGALAQGSIAGTAGPQSEGIVTVVLAGAAILGILEGLNIVFADCDGTVVAAALTIGKTELLQFANPGPWKNTYDYPGTDSPDGCGANSDYSVTYSVEATPPPVVVAKVAVPNIVGMSAENGVRALAAVDLIGIENAIPSDVATPSNIVGQTPAAGSQVAVHSEVHYDIKVRPVVTGKPGDPHPV